MTSLDSRSHPNTTPLDRRFPPAPPSGNLRQLVRDPLGFFHAAASQYGDIVCYRPAPEPAYLINHPDYVRHVLLDNNHNYNKSTSSNLLFNKVVGEGLLTSEGEIWRKQRRMMQPAFHHTRLERLDEMITQATGSMLDRWQEIYAAGQSVDLPREMGALTLTVTTRALFGVDIGDEAREIGELVTEGLEYLEKPSNPRLVNSIDHLNAVVDRIIQQRKHGFHDEGDLLSSLIQTRDEKAGIGMDDNQLRSQILTLMLAGYDTTASALSWTWYLLSQNPTAFDRLRGEVRSTLSNGPPSYADLDGLPYTRMVLNESLRMFPPAWALGRRAIGEDEIAGYYVGPNTVIAICIYSLHRHPGFWVNPDVFDPDRFTAENSAGRHKFAYIPFGAGPRQCIGNNFGLMEACLVIACIAQRFELHLMPGIQVQPQAVFVLRPARGLLMSLHP